MDSNKPILVLHDGDHIGRAIVSQLEAARTPLRELAMSQPVDEIVAAAFGCRAIIAVGDRIATNPALLSAANMPGIRALVLIVHRTTDFTTLRRHGAPYTVLRLAPLLEEVVAALAPVVASGKLILDDKGDVALRFIAAHDAAACAIAAVDHDDYCGRIVELCAPTALTVSGVAAELALVYGKRLKVSTWPRWMSTAMRAVGRVPFRAPDAFVKISSCEDASPLHPSPWRSIADVAAATIERRNNHALGMQ